MSEFSRVLPASAKLGEGPCWDPAAQCLWWLDILGHEIHRFDPATGADQLWRTPQAPGSLAFDARGGLLLAMGDGFYHFDSANGSFSPLVMAEPDMPETRMNDGRTDRQGRFWCGSVFEVDGAPPQPAGALYRLDADLSCRKMAKSIGCSNGLAWSPDGRVMYHTDSHTPLIWAWDYDPATGAIERRRIFVDLTDINAVADGATVDADGCYWVALPFSSLVHRYDPSGRLVRSLATPVDAPTCCEFGGEDLDILYVTTATLGRPSEQLADQPWAGSLLAIDVGVKGLAAAAWGGR